MNKTDNFIAEIDVSIIEIIPQRTQIDILRSSLNKNQSILDYSVENPETKSKFLSLKKILKSSSKINGIIFFSLIQFCYNNEELIDIELIRNLTKKYKLVFFKEKINIKSMKEFKQYESSLKFFKNNNLRIINKFI